MWERVLTRGTISVLLLLGLFLPSAFCDLFKNVTSPEYTLVNWNFGDGEQTILHSWTKKTSITISNIVKGDGLLRFNFSCSSEPTIIFSLKVFTFKEGISGFEGTPGPNSMFNISRGVASYSTGRSAGLIVLSLNPHEGTTMYISELTIEIQKGKETVLTMVLLDDTRKPVYKKTGLYISNSVSHGSRYITLARTGFAAWETVSFDNVHCDGCTEGFFHDRRLNYSKGLFRFYNCSHKNTSPFYKGLYVMKFTPDANLVFANITTAGPFLDYKAAQNGVLPSGGRLSVYNITTQAMFSDPRTRPYFYTTPSQSQIYFGPAKINGKVLTEKTDFENQYLRFTRIIDESRKVLYLASAKSRAVDDASVEGEFSAALCVSDGYSQIDSQENLVTGKTEARCVCNADRFVPHCTTTWDPLGKYLCAIGETKSTTTGQCVSCKMDHCVQCNAANTCAKCDKNYIVAGGGARCDFAVEHCKTAGADDTCDECLDGYTLSSDKKNCFVTIPNCEKYAESGTCLTCKDGLSPSENGMVCVSCQMDNCALCDQNGECSSCKVNYTLIPSIGCVECKVENCSYCYAENLCAACWKDSVCAIGGEQDTSKGTPWWVWLIVGLAAAVVVGLIIFFIVWCCFCTQQEFFVSYQEGYNEAEEKNGDRDLRLWDRNGSVSGNPHGAVFMTNDGRRPRIFKQEENSTHGDGTSFASSDSSSSSSSSRGSTSSGSESSSTSGHNR